MQMCQNTKETVESGTEHTVMWWSVSRRTCDLESAGICLICDSSAVA